MSVLGITGIENPILYYKMSSHQLSMLVLMITNIKSLLLYYKIVIAQTFYVSSRDNLHEKSYHIYNFVIASLIMRDEL